MEPLYLVDGSGYIFRAYFAIAPLTTSAGLPTNALFGFSRMMIKLLKDLSAHHIAITFDRPEPTFRHQMYDEYKANRDECPEPLAQQMPYFREISRALNIPVLEQAGMEADDIIGTLVHRFRANGQRIVVVSGDKDLCQLVDEQVEVWEPMRDIHYNTEGVFAKFGVYPNQIVDYLSLIGDSSDNVPGVKGIGPKTAQQLLQHFGTLDQLMGRVDEISSIPGLRGAASVKEKIASGLDILKLSRTLVTLKCDVEPWHSNCTLEDFQYNGPNLELLTPLFEKLEFDGMLKTLPSGGARVAAAAAASAKRFEAVTKASFPAFMQGLRAAPAFAFDTETDSLDTLTCGLVGMSFSWEAGVGYFLPFGLTSNPEANLDLSSTFEALREVFANPAVKKSGLNLKFDSAVLRSHGLEVEGIEFDSMLASYVLNADKRQHGLSALTKMHLHETMTEYKDLVGKLDGIQQVPLENITAYASHDAEASWNLRQILSKMLDDVDGSPVPGVTVQGISQVIRSPRFVFDEIEMPLLSVLEEVERAGIKIDTKLLQDMSSEFAAELVILEQTINELAGETFNLNSPKQLSTILFEKLGIPSKGLKKTQSGISTDASVLEKLAGEYEIVSKILDYRELFKLRSTYLESLQALVHPKTGRIHTSFNQAVAATGRLSSSDPNLQNIPIRNPRGRKIRTAFVAEEGKTFISADYSQIELRVLAHLSGDKNLRDTYHRGEDIHLATARELLGAAIASESELKDLRRVAKTINFGIVYGMSAFRLANELNISRTMASRYIDGYFARYPRVKEFFHEQEKLAESQGYVETLFGRRRYLQEIDTSGRDQGYAVRSVLNAPIQGTAADIIKLAMVRIRNTLKSLDPSARMVLQVHDELVFEVPEGRAEEYRELIVKEMEETVTLAVPLKVDVRISRCWG